MKKPLKYVLLAFSMAIITVAVWKYSGAGVAAVTAAFALIGTILADLSAQGALM